MDDLVSLCKRRGFIFQSGEIYGGMQGMYDFGPLGVELKNNLKQAWWSSMIYENDNIEGLDAAILSNPTVLRYSGHEDTFSDPMVDCKSCKSRWRSDLLEDDKCPGCGSKDLTEPRPFNLMFKTNIGPIDDGETFGYLRPETAQSIFTNFKNVVDSSSKSLPFGIAQIGKAFRNEITPRNFIFRVREFEQMAIQDQDTNKWVVPYVIEPSAGVERGILAIINEAYNVEKLENGKERTVLKLRPHLSPIKAAVIPLKKNNDELVMLAREVKNSLQKLNLGRIILENTGNIGKGYRRHDEIGTPLCITIDFDSLENKTATVRDRDSMEQEVVAIADLQSYLLQKINS